MGEKLKRRDFNRLAFLTAIFGPSAFLKGCAEAAKTVAERPRLVNGEYRDLNKALVDFGATVADDYIYLMGDPRATEHQQMQMNADRERARRELAMWATEVGKRSMVKIPDRLVPIQDHPNAKGRYLFTNGFELNIGNNLTNTAFIKGIDVGLTRNNQYPKALHAVYLGLQNLPEPQRVILIDPDSYERVFYGSIPDMCRDGFGVIGSAQVDQVSGQVLAYGQNPADFYTQVFQSNLETARDLNDIYPDGFIDDEHPYLEFVLNNLVTDRSRVMSGVVDFFGVGGEQPTLSIVGSPELEAQFATDHHGVWHALKETTTFGRSKKLPRYFDPGDNPRCEHGTVLMDLRRMFDLKGEGHLQYVASHVGVMPTHMNGIQRLAPQQTPLDGVAYNQGAIDNYRRWIP